MTRVCRLGMKRAAADGSPPARGKPLHPCGGSMFSPISFFLRRLFRVGFLYYSTRTKEAGHLRLVTPLSSVVQRVLFSSLDFFFFFFFALVYFFFPLSVIDENISGVKGIEMRHTSRYSSIDQFIFSKLLIFERNVPLFKFKNFPLINFKK